LTPIGCSNDHVTAACRDAASASGCGCRVPYWQALAGGVWPLQRVGPRFRVDHHVLFPAHRRAGGLWRARPSPSRCF